MIKTLDGYGLTRDSALLWLSAVAGGAAWLLGHFELVHQAIPVAGPKTNAWLQLIGAAAFGLSLYLRASPLGQRGTLGLRPDPERTLTMSGKLP